MVFSWKDEINREKKKLAYLIRVDERQKSTINWHELEI